MNQVLKNILLNEKEKANYAIQLESLPSIIGIPTGTTCNYKCIFCKDLMSSPTFLNKNITYEEFQPLADRIKHARNIGLFSWGEPLFNIEYVKMFCYISKNNPDSFISLSTNGSLMDDRICSMFLDHGLVHVNVSVNAPNESLYRLISGTCLFDRVKRNISELNSKASGKLFSKIKVILSLVLIPDVVDVLPSFVDLALETGCDEILIQNYKDFGSFRSTLSIDKQPQLQKHTNMRFLELKEKAFSEGIHVRVFSPISYLDEEFPYECWEPWERFWINMNGDVHVCCYAKQKMGNVFENSIETIWNNGLYQHFRSKVNTSDPPTDCRECPRRKDLRLYKTSI